MTERLVRSLETKLRATKLKKKSHLQQVMKTFLALVVLLFASHGKYGGYKRRAKLDNAVCTPSTPKQGTVECCWVLSPL